MGELAGALRRLSGKWTALSPGASRWPSCCVLGQREPPHPAAGGGASIGCYGGPKLAWQMDLAEGSQAHKPHSPFEPHCCRGATRGHKNIWGKRWFWEKAFRPDAELPADEITSPGLGFLTSACVGAWGEEVHVVSPRRDLIDWIKPAEPEMWGPGRQKVSRVVIYCVPTMCQMLY